MTEMRGTKIDIKKLPHSHGRLPRNLVAEMPASEATQEKIMAAILKSDKK